jgi:2,4-dienoyl-CoA reductase-like NADH-dependent reductase (Old Yellow Enzyme family)/thioredoxin reductase
MWNQLTIDNPQGSPRLYELVERIHRYGAKVAIQISAAGAKAKTEIMSDIVPLAPSAIKWERLSIIPREMTVEEIKRHVQLFVGAAKRAKMAGFDAVEVHCAHGYLLSSFISAYSNHRTDEYGGTLENRMRFPLEVIAAIKCEVGKDYPIMVRYNCEEYLEGGIHLEEAVKIGQLFEKSGVCVLDLSVGNAIVSRSSVRTIPPAFVPIGQIIPHAETIKSSVNIPVIVSGKIKDPHIAEDVLKQGKADFIGVGRGFIADPEWANKSLKGGYEDIRQCTGCNTCIYEKSWLGHPIRCQVNPTVGREAEFALVPASSQKKVLVIGGGPAGLEAARIAAIRGHTVTLFEADRDLGGQLRAAIIPPHKEIHHALQFLTDQVTKMGITVHLSTPVTSEMIEKSDADVIIVATGATHRSLDVPVADQSIVHTAIDILLGKAELAGKRIVVVGGGMIGCETAEYLAQIKKKKVTIIEMLSEIAQEVEPVYTRPALLERLEENKVDALVGTKVSGIGDRCIQCVDVEGKRYDIDCEGVVIATGTAPHNELVKSLEDKQLNVISIGDCVQARNLRYAIHEGYTAGFNI